MWRLSANKRLRPLSGGSSDSSICRGWRPGCGRTPRPNRGFSPCGTISIADATPQGCLLTSTIQSASALTPRPARRSAIRTFTPISTTQADSSISRRQPGFLGKSTLPVGTKVGTFSSKAVLGLLNNPCKTVLSVNFDLYQGVIDPNGPTVAELPVLDP